MRGVYERPLTSSLLAMAPWIEPFFSGLLIVVTAFGVWFGGYVIYKLLNGRNELQ
jgi:hypothetical protein